MAIRPSFLGLFTGGFLMLFSIIIFYNNYKKFNSSQVIMILLLLSIAVSVHSGLHSVEEIYYGWNPIEIMQKNIY
jgi:hypothetical protein